MGEPARRAPAPEADFPEAQAVELAKLKAELERLKASKAQ
jgi:hypothetical protein